MKLHQVVLPALMIAAISCTDDNEPHDQGCGAGIVFGVTEAWLPQSRAACDSTDYTLTLSSDTDSCRLDATATVTDMCDEAPQSRGTMASGIDAIKEFSIYSFYYPSPTAASRPFFADEQAQKQGDYWTTSTLYYWPTTDGSTLDFWALAGGPNLPGVTVLPSVTSASTMTIDYIVPASAALQTDLMVATTDPINTPGTRVPLNFRHICSAVKFVIGDLMQPGTIKEIRLSGIMSHGQYASTWSSLGTPATFILSPNKVTTSSPEDAGSAIVRDAYTLMMLPQTLGADAQLTVVFHDDVTGEDRTLTASLAGRTWPQGKLTTYRIGISPDYQLEFKSEPAVQDAHYVIYPVTIHAGNLPNGWTLTSNNTANVTFVESGKFVSSDVQALVDGGYWLDGHNGSSTLTSSTQGDVKVYVFLTENATEAYRDITLSLRPANSTHAKPATFNFTQYCPAWNNGIGVERIQDDDYPWGFNWDSNMKVTYSMPRGFWAGIWHVLFEIFGNHSYIQSSGSAWGATWKVTVDFSKVPALTTSTSANDGKNNTWEIINFDGINEAQTIMNQLESWGGTPDKTLPTNPNEFAARACAMKNKYHVETKTNSGATIYNPVLYEADLKWYLPAQSQAPDMRDNLSGDYWTSTAITDPGTTAYKYTAGGSTSPWNRNESIHVRAVRSKP